LVKRGNKVALIILDGVGITATQKGNAFTMAKKPYIDQLIDASPKALLKASAREVGLPWGEVGNSEVGHTNIGLGRVVLQDLPQIDRAIQNNTIAGKKTVKKIFETLATKGGNLHLIGVISNGAVHGHIRHLIAMITLFQHAQGLKKIYLHLISDGRDVPERSLQRFIPQVTNVLSDRVVVASLLGRYFAMDRDKNWDRISIAYQAILGNGKKARSVEDAISTAYAANETDEFITPATIGGFKDVDLENDAFLFTNYRSDRAIQLTRMFVDPHLTGVKRAALAKHFFTMTTYEDNLPAEVLFSNLDLNDERINPLINPLSKIVADAGLKQFYVAETEKYAHVTYFFSGGLKNENVGQICKLIPSKKVKTYAEHPQMCASEIADALVEASGGNYSLIVANFANGDMVGHSGELDPTIKAVEVLDQQLKKAVPQLLKKGYVVMLTADHGNCEEMIDLTSGKINKEHTMNPVFFLYITTDSEKKYLNAESFFDAQPIGILADIAPTILDELSLRHAREITGINLKKSLI